MRPIKVAPEVRAIVSKPAGLAELLAAMGRAGRGEATFEFEGETYRIRPTFSDEAGQSFPLNKVEVDKAK